MPIHHYKTWEEAAGLPEIATPLWREPQGVDLSGPLPEPLRFDPQRRRLLYRGFMASSSYHYLRSLSTDAAYLAALDELYQGTADAVSDRRVAAWVWAWLMAAVSLVGSIILLWKLRH